LTAPGAALIRTLEGHADWLSSVAISGDGTRAISGSDDQTLNVWDLSTGLLLRTLPDPTMSGHVFDAQSVNRWPLPGSGGLA
jgi:WD40 repeat protein